MDPEQFQARRATLEDLPQLKMLWAAYHLPVAELEKVFTQFQVAVNAEGELAGAVALQIEKQHGHIHSEAFTSSEEAPAIREVLWTRILNMAKNHGLVRLWTLPTVSFYREKGMTEVDEPTRKRIPPGIGNPMADWISLKLKDEVQPQLSLDQEFQLFAETQKGDSEKLMKQAQFLKVLAYGFFALVVIALAVLGFFVFKRLPRKR